VSEQGTVVELEDDTVIAAVLELQRRWAAYALCDLEPPHRQYARFIGAARDGTIRSMVLIYSPPGFTAVLPCGAPDEVAAILAVAVGLPDSPLLIVQKMNQAAMETRFHIEDSWTMLRMAVQPHTLKPVPLVDAEIVALQSNHLPEICRLYASWPDTVFTLFMFEHGVYYGAYIRGELVAISGTHAVSTRHQIGVIGNVFTHPEHRGRGLATAVTGAVARELFARGARDVALNAREDNLAAIAAYRRIGFQVEEPFWEARARLRG